MTAWPAAPRLYVQAAALAAGWGHGEEWDAMQGYCMKCREKREMKDVQQVTLKNGREARQGTCAVCGTTITVMGGAKAAQG